MQNGVELEEDPHTKHGTITHKSFGLTSLGVLCIVVGHEQDQSRFACVTGLRTEWSA